MNQNLCFGYSVHKKLKSILKEYSPRRIFLVTGEKSFTSSGAEELVGEIINKYNFIRFCNFKINPNLADIKKGIDSFNKARCDFVVGVGGGSVMDMAKAISILVRQKANIKEIIKDEGSLEDRKTPSIMIPTTAGTGSESTHFSVVYIGKKKYSLSHDSIIPDYAILDPIFTEKLPAYITACTGMDALCQAIESFWSVNSTNESRKYSKEAIELITANIVRAVNNPDRDSRLNMLKGSNYAGRAINIAKTTAAHSVSYPITAYFNIPHGHAVSLTLPYFFEYNYAVTVSNVQDKRGVGFVKARINELLEMLKVKTPKEAKEKMISIMKRINIETRLSEFGIDKDAIEIIIKNGFNAQRMKNNPKVVSETELRNILEKIK